MSLSISQPTFWLFIANAVLVITALLHMLYQRRAPQSLMAWLLTIILLPYIGVFIYFIFGLRKSLNKRYKPKIAMQSISETAPQNHLANQLNHILCANNIAGTTCHNTTTIYQTDSESYQQLIYLIENAQSHIHLETYIFEHDKTGKTILKALINKAKQGVQVRLLMDSIGSFKLYLNQQPLKALTQAGGGYAFFQPFWPGIISSQINLRNHRKIYLFDQKTLLTGGMNLSNDYLGTANQNEPKRWVDLMFEIQGPTTFHYQNIFNEDWHYTTKEKLSNPVLPDYPEQPTGEIIQVVPSGPDIKTDALFETLLNSIYQANIHIQIATPYFIPNSAIMNALLIALKRGVNVTLLTPETSDHLIFDLGRSSYMRDLSEAGGKVYYYTDNMLHSKLIIIDQLAAVIGSANFDYRSLFINYEIVNFIYSEPLIQNLSQWFDTQLDESVSYQPSPARGRVIFENMTRIITPIL